MSWLRQDRLFSGIPTGGTVDFAFADLTPDAVLVGLNPRDFARRVHAGLFVGWVHHVVALVAERPVDRGKVMACTFRLREQLEPASRRHDHDGRHDPVTWRDAQAGMTNASRLTLHSSCGEASSARSTASATASATSWR